MFLLMDNFIVMNFEKTECQYCGDAGLCEFCERGKVAISEYLEKQKKGGEVDNGTVAQEKPVEMIPVEERDDNWTSLMGGGK
jgi:hypothetical protein